MTTTLLAPTANHTRYWLGSWTDLLDSSHSILRDQAYARYRAGVAQLSRIISDKPISVTWGNKSDAFSYQDNNDLYHIVIPGFNTTADADCVVGLGLHEASHITHSKHFFRIMNDIKGDAMFRWIRGDLLQRFTTKGAITEKYMVECIRSCFNILEDFRIDEIQYRKFTGYRGYYRALYQKYYDDPRVIERLADDKRTMHNYLAHLVFCRHENFNPDLLPGMHEILEVFDYPNTQRFTNDPKIDRLAANNYVPTKDTIPDIFATVQEILCIILDNIDEIDQNDMSSPEYVLVTGKLAHEFEQVIDVQMSDEDIKKLNEGTAIDMEVVPWADKELGMAVTGVVYTNYHKQPDQKPFYDSRSDQQDSVATGINLGKLLARRLKIMGEETDIRFNRKTHGYLDKRRLAALGHDDESVFEMIHDVKYEPVFVDVTVDASGSMTGNWYHALQFMSTMATAALKCPKLDVRISLRDHVSGGYTESNTASVRIGVIFDSRINDLAHIQRVFPKIVPSSETPEGVAFDIMLKTGALSPVAGKRNYFVNLSDGLPGFSAAMSVASWDEHGNPKTTNNHVQYGGQPAINHTRKVVKKLREHYRILSYFLTNGGYDASEDFRTMYGSSAETLEASNLQQIVRTLNHLFVERD